LGIYAELRREFFWGNWNLVFFEVMGGYPRGATEEGGTMCVFWGNLCQLDGIGDLPLLMYGGEVFWET
jgi:hypothetical protein